ncbi:MAG: ATP-binding cassette domain-containing protein [bacterium]|nr:ATP-binding cassette domain-containing protein [bacterium]
MASIIAENISLVFPLVGSDSRFGSRLGKKNKREGTPVGGQIITDHGRSSGIVALDHLNISLKDGDRLGIFGHNGAGKSTLLRVLGGIYPPTSGTIKIDGKVTGMFSLGLGINKDVTGYENILLKGLIYGLRKREIQELIPEIAEYSELGDFLDMPVKIYSSGMILRLMFSIASVMKPEILLLDEWISSSDKKFKRKMDERLESMLEVTPIVVIASHNEDRLYHWSNRVITLERGRVVPESKSKYQPPPPPRFRPDKDLLNRYTKLTNFAKVEEALALLPQIWPEDADLILHQTRKAALLMQLGRNDEAVTAIKKALELAPEDARLINQLGVVYFRLKEYDTAVTFLEKALRTSEGMVGKVELFEIACEKAGQTEKVDKIWELLDEVPVID